MSVSVAHEVPMSASSTAAPLKVVFCFDTFEIGGTEMNAVRTLERLDRSAIDVRAICLAERGPLLERVRAAGVPITEYRIGSLFSLRAVRAGMRLASWLRRERIDVLHSHDIYTNIFAIPWARAAGVPLIIASRRWWTETRRPAHVWLNRLSYRMAHGVLANSESVCQLVVREGVTASRVAVIPNFVDADAFSPPRDDWMRQTRAMLGLGQDHEVIGIIANFHGIKDHASLLRAAAILLPQHPGLRVVLVGDGVERKALEQQADSLGIRAQVVFAGRLPHQPSLHWVFDVSVLCSRGEGFPNSIVEAMAAGRPVVATRVGGVGDVVIDDQTGFLVPAEDPRALADALHRALSNRARAHEMGAAGAHRARTMFYADEVIRRLEALYRSGFHSRR